MRRSLLILVMLVQACASSRAGGDDSGATFTVEPMQGSPGERVEITATGLPPQTRLHIGAGPPASEYEIFAEAVSDASGRLVTAVRVPAWAEPGRQLIFAISRPGSAFDVLSEPFTVE